MRLPTLNRHAGLDHPVTARLRREESYAIKDLIALNPGSSPG